MNHTRVALLLIIVVYLCVGALYAVKTPDWQVPDEPAHYNYIRALAEDGRFPVLEMGDYDQDYLGRLTNQGFPPQLSVDSVEYEDHQPPLYYLLATPVYLAFDGALIPLRLFSVLIGAGVVLLAYAVAATVFPDRPLIGLGTAAFVAFLPQHVAMMAGVNNDSLAELLIGVALWMTVRWIKALGVRSTKGQGGAGERQLAGLGVVLGLGLVTKTTVAPVALAVFVALLLAWRRGADENLRGLVRHLVLVFGPALFIVALWWIRNVSIYGGLDIYGLANHDTVVVGQPRTADWIRDQGLSGWLERGLTFTFQSFWGQFGWMGVVMPTWLYRALAVWSGMLTLGFLYWLREARNEQRIAGDAGPYPQRNMQLIFLAATVGFVILAYLYYNRTFVQHQGRYLFPALIPIALGVALATEALLCLVRLPQRLRPLAFATPYLAMVALDLYALWRFVIPALT
jgi:4-amino-4-deoxy-L-arabinose transferase-like glycosyltransferase